ncbi:MAG: hypothetical protein JXL20_10350 [Deltaproteobacteria bacterium]|nr:hypothetical protein [Deltaproteobacteria bacterium]
MDIVPTVVRFLGIEKPAGSMGKEIFGNPRHPYTAALMKAIPYPDGEAGRKKRNKRIKSG